MSPMRISIDLNQSPIQIGGYLMQKYLVTHGTKGAVVNKTTGLAKHEVVEVCNDANQKTKDYFGVLKFDAAVVVVPNSTENKIRSSITSYAQSSLFNVTQVIEERVAVAVAYAHKAESSAKTKLAIVSLNAGILDVSIMGIIPNEGGAEKSTYVTYDHKAYPAPVHESGEQSGGGFLGLVGGAVQTLVVDPFEKAVGALKSLLQGLKLGAGGEVDKVVLVGKAAQSDQLREAVKQKFSGAELWSEFRKPEEIAAYGAAVLSFHDARITLMSESEFHTVFGSPDKGFYGG